MMGGGCGEISGIWGAEIWCNEMPWVKRTAFDPREVTAVRSERWVFHGFTQPCFHVFSDFKRWYAMICQRIWVWLSHRNVSLRYIGQDHMPEVNCRNKLSYWSTTGLRMVRLVAGTHQWYITSNRWWLVMANDWFCICLGNQLYLAINSYLLVIQDRFHRGWC